MRSGRPTAAAMRIAASLLGLLVLCGLGRIGPMARYARAGDALQLDPSAAAADEDAVLAETVPVDFEPALAEGCHGPPCCMATSCGWFTLDYLHWWMQGDRVPALVTTSPSGTPRMDAGVLGLPTTTVLFGDERINDGGRPGLRLGLGRWLDDCQRLGLGLEFFWVGDNPEQFLAFSQGDPILARPFFNTDPSVNGADAQLVAFDDPLAGDVLDGAVRVETSSETYSAAPHFYHLLSSRHCADRGYRVHLVGGYRFFRMNESLRISESLLVTEAGGLVAQGTTLDVFDEFGASNEFHGGEIGLRTRMCCGTWSLDVLAKLGVGNNHQRVRINGQNKVTVPDFAPFTSGGGLLAQAANSGDYENDEFALLPELQLNLAWQWTPCTRMRIGYTLLFLTDAVRPGDHMDRTIDGRFLDPLAAPFVATSPAFAFDSTSVWMQGVNLGIERVW